MPREDLLFFRTDLFSVQEHQRQEILNEIARMDGNRLLNSNPDDLTAYFAEKYSINVPTLDKAGMQADQKEAQIDVSGDPRRMISNRSRPFYVPGTRITVWIPFDGDADLFKVRPNNYTMSPPRGRVVDQTLEFALEGTNITADQARAEIDQWLNSVEQYLSWHRDGLRGFNEGIASLARDAIMKRRAKLLADQRLVESLGIPLRHRDGALPTYKAPEVRRKIAPKMPTSTTGPYKPEPTLEMAEYENILGIMQSMVKVMERSPKAFHDIGEEDIRMHFLVQLNGQYQGQATGETFNYQGKTDILIRSGDRNIFIAECKFWGGPAKLSETIDQLLSYLSWRDSKTAILLFNRNKDFSKVLAAIPHTVKSHQKFRKELLQPGETAFRYVFRNKDDDAKDLIVTILAFDVPRHE